MARPIWSGSISFGLVTIPVELFTMVVDRDVHFRMVTPKGTQVRQKLVCEETGKEIERSTTVKAYDTEDNRVVIIDPKEIEALKPESGHTLAIEQFVELEEIDPVYFAQSYYLFPAKGAEMPYRLLTATLAQTGKAAIGSFNMRQRTYVAAIRVRDDVMVLSTLHYSDEIREASEVGEIPSSAKYSSQELALATQLVKALTGEFNPEKFKNEYRDTIVAFLEKKAKGLKPVPVKSAKRAQAPTVVDLMSRLKASLEQRPMKGKNAKQAPRDAKRGGRHAA